MVRKFPYDLLEAEWENIFGLVSSLKETVILTQGEKDAVAIIPAEELAIMLETIRLLSSPENGIRLLTTLQRAASHDDLFG
jgi:PHD/YefM family antitoxin component YafN of YafNO toxin-antitoxin module